MANEIHDTTTGSEPDAPAGTTAPPVAKSLDEMTDDEVLNEIRNFARQFAVPEWGCNREDARWFEENFAELVRLYRGQIVVVYNRAVVAHGRDAHRLELAAARKLNVTPDCLTVELVYAPEL